MAYYTDPEKISLKAYQKKLETAYLSPGRLILRENAAERFGHFEKLGIDNLKALINLLRNKKEVSLLRQTPYFRDEYLTILLREINSMFPKPNKLKDFRNLSQTTIETLAKCGIKDTKALFNRVLTPDQRQLLANQTGIPLNETDELASLTDLSRIKWVGAIFASMLFDLGVKNVREAAVLDPVELHKNINKLNSQGNYFKGKIGLNDIRIFVAAAGDVPLEMEF